jgi:hypothetical protein
MTSAGNATWNSGNTSRKIIRTDLEKEESPLSTTWLTICHPGTMAEAKRDPAGIDCLRLDQWLVLEPFFYDYVNVIRDYYYSVLPTATPFSRNAIFSGLFPEEIEKKYPELWVRDDEDENSLNKYEMVLLEQNLQRNGINLERGIKYIKIMNNDDARYLEKNLNSFMDTPAGDCPEFVDVGAQPFRSADPEGNCSQ